MSVEIEYLAGASDLCNTIDKGRKAIDIKTLNFWIEETKEKISSKTSRKDQERDQKKIDAYSRIVATIESGGDIIDLLDSEVKKSLDSSIDFEVYNKMENTVDEIVDSFYDSKFVRQGNKIPAANASRIYSRDELTEKVRNVKSSFTSNILPDDLIGKIKKNILDGDYNHRQSLRKELSRNKSGSPLWKYDDFVSEVRILCEKVTRASGERSAKYDYGDAVNSIKDFIDNTLVDYTDLLQDEKKGTAIAELLIYPDILGNLRENRKEVDDNEFHGLCEILNRLFSIDYSDELLIAVLPYLGFKLPSSASTYGNDYKPSKQTEHRKEDEQEQKTVQGYTDPDNVDAKSYDYEEGYEKEDIKDLDEFDEYIRRRQREKTVESVKGGYSKKGSLVPYVIRAVIAVLVVYGIFAWCTMRQTDYTPPILNRIFGVTENDNVRMNGNTTDGGKTDNDQTDMSTAGTEILDLFETKPVESDNTAIFTTDYAVGDEVWNRCIEFKVEHDEMDIDSDMETAYMLYALNGSYTKLSFRCAPYITNNSFKENCAADVYVIDADTSKILYQGRVDYYSLPLEEEVDVSGVGNLRIEVDRGEGFKPICLMKDMKLYPADPNTAGVAKTSESAARPEGAIDLHDLKPREDKDFLFRLKRSYVVDDEMWRGAFGFAAKKSGFGGGNDTSFAVYSLMDKYEKMTFRLTPYRGMSGDKFEEGSQSELILTDVNSSTVIYDRIIDGSEGVLEESVDLTGVTVLRMESKLLEGGYASFLLKDVYLYPSEKQADVEPEQTDE